MTARCTCFCWTLFAGAYGLTAAPHQLLGKHALIISGTLPFEPDRSLCLADEVLADGASVTLLVPLPRSGAAVNDEASLRLLLRIQRQGFPKLMETLGFSFGTPGQYGMGNRPRVDFKHCRADDVETLALALSDADLLLMDVGPLEDALVGDAALSSARFTMQRGLFSLVLRRLRAAGQALNRDAHRTGVRWAWLDSMAAPPPAEDEVSTGR